MLFNKQMKKPLILHLNMNREFFTSKYYKRSPSGYEKTSTGRTSYTSYVVKLIFKI